MSDELKKFRLNKVHTENLQSFLGSDTGRELLEVLRAERRANVRADLSESRLLGRHDVWQRLDDIFEFGTAFLELRQRQSSKAATIPAHASKLP